MTRAKYLKKSLKRQWLISQSVYGTVGDGRFRTNPRWFAWKSHPGSLTVWFKRGGGFVCWADTYIPNLLSLRGRVGDIHAVKFNY